MCESSIWNQLSTAFPIVDHQLANLVTFCNMFVSACVLVCLHKGMYVVGYVLLVVRMYLDMLDGSVARECSATRFGNMFDHALDILFTTGALGIVLVSSIPTWIKCLFIVGYVLPIYVSIQIINGTKIQDNFQSVEDNLLIFNSIMYATIAILLHAYS